VQLTVGPLLTGLGLLLLARIGPHASWVTDVLPGAVVFGLGLVAFVAPLTATVMSSVHPDHVSVGSGVNNAIARTAALAALAVVPVVSGLSSAAGAAAVTHAFRVSLVIAAAIAASAGALGFFGLGSGPLVVEEDDAVAEGAGVDQPEADGAVGGLEERTSPP
jgi:uncharacterized membrane protein HdeD (DUF308 family)